MLYIYKAFIRPHLDYADVIYDQPHNESFCNRIESVQYNAALAITGAIRGSSRDRVYQELGLESLRDRRWYRRLVFFFNIVHDNVPSYLKEYLPVLVNSRYNHRNSLLRRFVCHTNSFNNTFFPYCVNEWNKLDPVLRELESISLFKKSLLRFIRPKAMPVYGLMDPPGLKLLTRLRVNFSHLREHKFRHNFRDTLVPFCNCGLLESETTNHFLLRCTSFSDLRKILLDGIID